MNRNDALPPEMLKRIVGGARIGETREITPDIAAGLTAGMDGDHDAPGGNAGAKSFALTKSNVQSGAQGAFEIKLDLEKRADGGTAAKFDLAVSGVKGKPDALKVTVVDHATKERTELTARDVTDRAESGDRLYAGVADILKKLDASRLRPGAGDLNELEDALRGSFKEKVGHSNKLVDPAYTKITKTLETTTDAAGKPVSDWKTEKESSAQDRQKAITENAAKMKAAADKVQVAQQAAAKAAQQVAAKAAQQAAVAGSHHAVKSVVDSLRAVASVATAATTAADKAMVAKAMADGDSRVAAAKQDLAKQTYDHALKRFADANATGSPKAPALRAAVEKAADEYTAARQAASDAGKTAGKVNIDAGNANQKLAAAHSAVEANKAALANAIAAAKTAHKAVQDSDTRSRSSSVPAKPAAAQGESDNNGSRARSNSTAGQVDTSPAKLAERPDAPKAKKTLMEKTANAIGKHGGKLIQDKAWAAGTKAVNAGAESLAQNLAKAKGSYHETESSNVLAGGVKQTVTVNGNQTVTDTTLAQVKTESGSMSYSSALGQGAAAHWNIHAEAGVERTTKTDLGNGVSLSQTNKAYAGAAFENEAKASITATSASASASTTLSAHAEISHSQTTDYGGVKVTDKVQLAADAQATAKAGVSLGFDGVKAELKAGVEASVKATGSKEVEIGDVKVKSELTVFAKAKAEAKADMAVTFNPLGKEGVKVKGGFGAEAAAGVGLEGTTGFKGKDGNGADVGGGVYVGKIGVKTDGGAGFKDGRLSLELNIGASVGIGGNIHIKADSNIGKSYGDAVKDIKNGNLGEKALGVARAVSGVLPNFIIGLFN